MNDKIIQVRFYNCNCDWTLKYCDECHTVYAQVPAPVLMKYEDTGDYL